MLISNLSTEYQLSLKIRNYSQNYNEIHKNKYYFFKNVAQKRKKKLASTVRYLSYLPIPEHTH